jgi:hypothetical protein
MSQVSSIDPPWKTLARCHQVWGWRLLLIFLSLGLVLEGMHGFKVGFYLDPKNSMRRELWTLAHAHGTLVSVVHLLFSLSISGKWWFNWRRAKLASQLLFAAGALLPGGFFLGGTAPPEGDPWIGIWAVPVGGLFLIGAVLLATLEGRHAEREDSASDSDK